MTPMRLLLAVLLALPSVSAAQARAGRAAAPVPTLVAPALSFAAPALASFPSPAPVLAHAAGDPGAPDAATPAPAPFPALFAAADAADPASAPQGLDQAAARLAAAFDGQGRARSSDGAVFEARPDPSTPGTVRIVRLTRAPPAPTRAVPGTEGLSGRDLLEALGKVAARGQRRRKYEEASLFLFSTADNVEIGGVRGVVDAYSGVFVPGTSDRGRDYPERGDRNRDGHVDEGGMNVEHVWPQGHFDQKLPMRSDIHHLMATFIHPNGVRANLPYGVVKGRPVYQNDAGARSDGAVFEPPDFTKGRAARDMLYFYARYRGSRIFQDPMGPRWWERQIDLLLDWNRRFPPDLEELRRNDESLEWQGNRNPFVDDPGLADRVGREAWRPSPPPRKKGGGKLMLG